MTERVLPDNIRELLDKQFAADERRIGMRVLLRGLTTTFGTSGASDIEIAEAYEAEAQAARARHEDARLAERKLARRRGPSK